MSVPDSSENFLFPRLFLLVLIYSSGTFSLAVFPLFNNKKALGRFFGDSNFKSIWECNIIPAVRQMDRTEVNEDADNR